MSTVAPFVAVSTTVCPNRRPPRPKHPKFTQFHRSGLHFGRIHPQHRQYGDSSKAYGDCRSVRGRRQGLAGQRADAPNHTSTTCPTGMEGTGGTGGHGQPDPTAPGIPAGPSCGARGRRSPAGQRADAPGHAQRYSAAGVEGAGGSGGHGQPDPTAPGILAGPSCGARGRRQGLAGQRADAPGHAQRYSAAGVEGAGGSGGPGRASRRGAERSEALASRAAGPSGARNTSGTTSDYDSPATTSPRGSRRARLR